MMAEQGKKLDDATIRTMERLREARQTIREVASNARVAKSTAQKYLGKTSERR